MSFRFKNGPQPVKIGPALDIEMLIIELSIGIVSSVMAFGAHQEELAVLFLPCVIVAVLCYFLVVVGVLRFAYDWLRDYFTKEKKVMVTDDKSRECLRDD